MKKSITFIALFFNAWCFSQEFQFQLNFEDAVGNMDSIVLGYDDFATDSIDLNFGEMNILDAAWKSELDVRVSNNWDRTLQGDHATFHTKTQIIQTQCNGYEGILIPVNIKTKNWPVTASWIDFVSINSDGCIYESHITCNDEFPTYETPNCYVGKNVTLLFNDLVELQVNIDTSGLGQKFFHYELPSGDTISLVWVWFSAFYITDNSGLQSLSADLLVVSPSPSTDVINVKVPENFGDLMRLRFYSSIGKEVKISEALTTVDVSLLQSGIYTLVAENKDGRTCYSRFVKE